MSVAHLVAEVVDPFEVGRGRVLEPVRRRERDRAALGGAAVEGLDLHRVAVGVGVVAEHVDLDGGVGLGRSDVVDGHWLAVRVRPSRA